MKIKTIIALICVVFLSTACLGNPPEPIHTQAGVEFTLAPEQTAIVDGTDLKITFISISSDQRCPSGMECAMSGPVSVSFSIQQGNQPSEDLALQTFTDGDGRAPDMKFEGIKDQTTIGNNLIQVKAVKPYPEGRFDSIKAKEYRLTLLVTKN